jgi:PAS domain S-box-containing protein
LETANWVIPGAPQVLIVEDEGLIARDIGSMLNNLGYDVAGPTASGAEALEVALSERPDVVLMDIRIRGEWDGIETAQKIRERLGIPIVFLTAYADEATLQRAKSIEPFGYIVKPFTASHLKVSLEISLQRYQAQRRLEEREASLGTAARQSSDAIFVCDINRRVKFLNPAAEALIGLRAANVYGKRVSELFKFQSEGFDETDLPLPAGGFGAETCLTTGIVLRADGKQRLVIASLAPVREGTAPAFETVMLFRDISEIESVRKALRSSNDQLGQSNETFGQVYCSLAHDLQEPLRTITLAAQILARAGADETGDASEEYLDWITGACARMQAVITAMLNYHDAASLGSFASAVPVNSAKALEGALLNLRAARIASGAAVDFANLPEVRAHPVALLLLFQNLIENALKFRRVAAPRIQVSAQRDGEFWTFTVADNGAGFDGAQSERIFSLFNRAHGGEIEGHGIGLATCRRLVEQFGGRIWAESIIGQGSKFHFTLPAIPAFHAVN